MAAHEHQKPTVNIERPILCSPTIPGWRWTRWTARPASIPRALPRWTGARTARRIPGNTPDADNNAKLLRLLKDVPLEKRTARFRCVIALVACRRTSRGRQFAGLLRGRIRTADFRWRVRGPDYFFTTREKRVRLRPAVCAGWFRADIRRTRRRREKQIKPPRQALVKLKKFFSTG